MATIKTIEYHCPHCNKKLRTTPYTDHCCIKGKLYGSPREICPRCKNSYFNPQLNEPALELTLNQDVPLVMTATRTLVAEIIIAVACCVLAFYGVPEALVLLPVLAGFHMLLSVLTRPYRRKHKNKVLIESRKRIREDIQYFIELVARTPMYDINKAKLVPADILMMHAIACAEMDGDRVLKLRDIALSVLNRKA